MMFRKTRKSSLCWEVGSRSLRAARDDRPSFAEPLFTFCCAGYRLHHTEASAVQSIFTWHNDTVRNCLCNETLALPANHLPPVVRPTCFPRILNLLISSPSFCR
jgi:hypothetical protein